VLLAGIVLGAWYGAYPRDDAYLKGHGYNVSSADIEAVNDIEADAHGDAYIVLANQSVSAAAISTIGFRYYGPQFFYPIPTGGDLYQDFLNMDDAPSEPQAESAIQTVEDECLAAGGCQSGLIDHLYFVVDNYWWNAGSIDAQAKAIANKEIDVQNGAVEIFRFDR
jgi:hypothetical protein